jgi:cytochrome d ubiquinol oxidase subunit II
VLWGVAFANITRGVPLDADHEYTGGLLTLLNPYALLGGVTTLALFVTHGAVFLGLKTTGGIRDRANAVAGRAGLAAAALVVAFLAWTVAGAGTAAGTAAPVALAAAAALAMAGGLAANRVRREGWAFAGTATAIALTVATLFAALFPEVLPSTVDPAYGLTVDNASSGPYTMKVMTWVAVAAAPAVLLYQGWTYWVFRRRIGVGHIPR